MNLKMQLPWSSSGPPTQRTVETQPLSSPILSIFQGTYAWTKRTSCPLQHNRKGSRTSPRISLPLLDISNNSAPVLRSPTSTRSLIDPSSSPAITPRPLSTITFDHLPGAPNLPVQAHHRVNRPNGITYHSARLDTSARFRRRPRWRPRHSSGRDFLPFMKKQGMKRRIFSCVVTGSILAVTLIVCK